MSVADAADRAKPFLKWAGGKRQLLPAIAAALPTGLGQGQYTTYVEPLVGGGAVLFWLLQTYPSIRQAVINDINPDLVMAYQVVQQQPEALIAALLALQQAYYQLADEAARLAFYEAARAEFNTRPLPAVRNTALLLFLNRTCFNGLYRVNRKGGFNVPFGRYDQPVICYPAVIRAASRVLARVTIVQGDFAALLAYATPDSFWYFDPPYKPLSRTASFNAYSPEVFGDADQQRLASFCQELDHRQVPWLLSNSDPTPAAAAPAYFDDLYAGFRIRRVPARRSINAKAEGRGYLSELLISNYEPGFSLLPA